MIKKFSNYQKKKSIINIDDTKDQIIQKIKLEIKENSQFLSYSIKPISIAGGTRAASIEGYYQEISAKDFYARVFNRATNIQYKGMAYDDVEDHEVPSDRTNRDKWRGEKGKGIYIDDSVKSDEERKKEVEDELIEELNKENPDTIKALKLRMKLDRKEY